MGVRATARRLRAWFRRTRKRDKTPSSSDANEPTPGGRTGNDGDNIHNIPSGAHNDESSTSTHTEPAQISRDEMELSADSQDSSRFFSRLPLEIRRQIYRQVWQDYLEPSRRTGPASPGSDLRLHIYTDDSVNGTLRHTQCKVHPGDPVQEDTLTLYLNTPWPFDGNVNPTVPAPPWFWFAWVMRIHWGKHWKCQHAIQQRWDPHTGRCREVPKAPFLPLFLTCRKLYSEAVVSFFENVTPIFTCSWDAQRFFVEQPHRYLTALRSLEFNFCNANDYLYLSKVWRNSLNRSAAAAAAARIVNPPAADENPESETAGSSSSSSPPESRPAATVVHHKMKNRLLGKQLWDKLLTSMQEAAPNLRDLDICIAGRIKRQHILSGFGYPGSSDDSSGVIESEQTLGEGGARHHNHGEPEACKTVPAPWKLRGNLTVLFSPDGDYFVQQDGVMVPQREVEEDEEQE